VKSASGVGVGLGEGGPGRQVGSVITCLTWHSQRRVAPVDLPWAWAVGCFRRPRGHGSQCQVAMVSLPLALGDMNAG